MRKSTILCDFDLDGAGCCLLTKWVHPNREFQFIGTNEKELMSYLSEADPKAPVFVYDIAFDQSHIDIADRPNVVFVHHHEPQTNLIAKNCKVICHQETSCVKLLQKLYQPDLSDAQNDLLSFIDDYDCYDLLYKKSLFYNMLFWSYSGNKIEKFVEAFENGDRPFSDLEKNMIKLYASKMLETAKNSDPHIYRAKNFNILFFYADFAINELCAELSKKYDCDAAVAINEKTMHAWIRINREKQTNFDCGIFSKIYMNGHGFKNFGSGEITDKILELSKSFNKV